MGRAELSVHLPPLPYALALARTAESFPATENSFQRQCGVYTAKLVPLQTSIGVGDAHAGRSTTQLCLRQVSLVPSADIASLRLLSADMARSPFDRAPPPFCFFGPEQDPSGSPDPTRHIISYPYTFHDARAYAYWSRNPALGRGLKPLKTNQRVPK